MAERLNAAVLKTVISRDRDRGFESLSLLHSFFSPRKSRTFLAADKNEWLTPILIPNQFTFQLHSSTISLFVKQ